MHRFRSPRFLGYLLPLVVLVAGECVGEDAVFSGPQVGEPLPPMRMILVGGPDNGKEVDPVERAGGKPTLMIFVHHLTRPGAALTRGLAEYAVGLKEHGVETAIIWLDDDKATAENYLTRAAQSLRFPVPPGISVDGGEGPGAYGLNRNVELTILVADENRVTANFALVQPSVTEAVKIAGELSKRVGQPAPSADQFNRQNYRGRAMKPAGDGGRTTGEDNPSVQLRELMRTLVSSEDDSESLAKTVEKIEAWVGKEPWRQQQLRRMSAAVLERANVSAQAEKQLRRWVEMESPAEDPSR